MYSYTCIEDLIDVRNECKDQTNVIFYLDNLGLNLASAAKIADEKFQTGNNLVSEKIKQSVHYVISELKINIYKDDDTECDLDTLICENSEKIAEAVYYKTAAYIYQELKLNSSRFNDYVKYSAEKVDQMLLMLDSSYEIIWRLGGGDGRPPMGLFQKEMQKLKPLQKRMESLCVKECVGARHIITIP